MGKRTIGRKLVGLALAAALWLPSAASAESAQPEQTKSDSQTNTSAQTVEPAPTVQSEGAVLIDAKSGEMLYALNQDKQFYPASITKIVTGIIAIETTSPDEIVTVSKEARNEDGTRIYLAEGEKVPMGKLLYGLLMNSGNDAATAIAEHIDGSKEKFAERMNQFVREKIGVTNTTFKNPSGLPDPEHVTTASDMAKIARYAMQNETFRKIVSTKTMPWNGEEWKSELVNHNKMLWTYEGATGIKNGYTEAAGNTLVTSATRGDMDLIGVVMKSPTSDAAYSDMKKLLDYGFNNFHMTTMVAAGQTFTVKDGNDVVNWKATDTVAAAAPNNFSSAPPVTVTKDGSVTVDSKYGAQAIGKLTEQSRTNTAAEAQDNKSKGEVKALSATAEGTQADSGHMDVLWPTLAILALIAGWFGYRATRRRMRL